MLQTSKIILISYKLATYSNLLSYHIPGMFCYLGKFGPAVLLPSLPDQATKKKENCRNLDVCDTGDEAVM